MHKATALHLASLCGAIKCITGLLEFGADAMLDDKDVSGNTSLHNAAERGNLDCVRLLLETAADTTLRNNNNQTAYDLALINNFHAVAALLRQYDHDGVVGFSSSNGNDENVIHQLSSPWIFAQTASKQYW